MKLKTLAEKYPVLYGKTYKLNDDHKRCDLCKKDQSAVELIERSKGDEQSIKKPCRILDIRDDFSMFYCQYCTRDFIFEREKQDHELICVLQKWRKKRSA